MKKKNIASEGSMSLSSNKKTLLIGDSIDRLGLKNKIDGRDCVPSPYLTGLLDKFLDGKYIPSFETARGCPFSCHFAIKALMKQKLLVLALKE